MLDGAIGEWTGIPPTGNGEPWAAKSAQGLVIAGHAGVNSEFSINPPKTQGRPLDIWLSLAEPFELPEFDFDDKWCAGRSYGVKADSDSCQQWVRDQNRYRGLLLKQFARYWRVAPGGAEERYALTAYDELTEEQRKATGLPRPPAGLPVRRFRPQPDGSTTFELLIPWEIFPPANRLQVERIQLALGMGQELKGAPPVNKTYMHSAGWIAVAPPISSRTGRCGQPLLADNQLTFYFLNQSHEIDSTFTLQNYAWPYFPFPPRIDDLHPEVRYQRFFSQALSEGEHFCGPYFSYRRGSISRNFSLTIQRPPDSKSSPFPVKVLPDGTRLIRSGPAHWGQPEGWRHSYDVIGMTIYSLTPSLQAYEALRIGAMLDLPLGYEIEISDDWRTVTEFKQEKEGNWSSKRYCFSGHLYQSCGQNPNSTGPRRRVLTR